MRDMGSVMLVGMMINMVVITQRGVSPVIIFIFLPIVYIYKGNTFRGYSRQN